MNDNTTNKHKSLITWKFNSQMNYQGEFHDMYYDGEYQSAWIQRMSPSGSQWAFCPGLVHGMSYHAVVRHSFAEAQADGIAWWAARELERYHG